MAGILYVAGTSQAHADANLYVFQELLSDGEALDVIADGLVNTDRTKVEEWIDFLRETGHPTAKDAKIYEYPIEG